MGAAKGTAETAGNAARAGASGLVTGGKTLAAYQDARRVELEAVRGDLEREGIDITDPVQMRDYMDRHPDIAQRIATRAIANAFATFMGRKANTGTGAAIDAMAPNLNPLLGGVLKAGAEKVTKETAQGWFED
jgi:hypothetical protein